MSPAPASSPLPASTIWHAIWQVPGKIFAASPAFAVAIAVVLTLSVAASARTRFWRLKARDPVRRFSRADKARIVYRAAVRCEHHGLLLGRCRVTEGLEADHIHPHSRGGETGIHNGQALCRRHNRLKFVHIPWAWELRRLERRRRSYFPAGMPTAVKRTAKSRTRPPATAGPRKCPPVPIRRSDSGLSSGCAGAPTPATLVEGDKARG
jgi:5-methylcytosine-specific restriction endonuclease McrA